MIVQRFGSVGNYLNYCESPVESSLRRTSQVPPDRWSGLVDWPETVRLAEHGWDEGIEQVERFTAKLVDTVSGQIPEMIPRWDEVEGDFFDVDRYLADDPECMVSIVDSGIRYDANPPRIVRLVANICVSGAIDPQTLIMRGAAMCALAQVLERHGTRVEIEMVAANRAGEGLETIVTLKQSGESLHMPNVVFHLAHPASLRKMVFSCWEHLSDPIRTRFNFIDGRGYRYVGESQDRGDIYLPGLESRWAYSEESTVKWIEQELKKQGIEVKKNE